MPWHVQYREHSAEHVLHCLTPEAAIEAACELIDQGSDVFGIGTGSLTDSISTPEIARIYDLWARAKAPFGTEPTRVARAT